MRRRTLLGTVSGTITTWITGCLGGVSTVGNVTTATTTRNRCDQVETWAGVECEVSPTEIRRDAATGDYRLDCELSVRFEYPSGDTGFGDALLVGYDADGRLLSAVPADRLTWRDVPERNRRTDDCGYSHGSLSRTVTLPTPAIPAQIGLSFVRYAGETGAVFHAAAEGTPTATDASQYERLSSGDAGFRRAPDLAEDAPVSVESVGLETERLDERAEFDPAMRDGGGDLSRAVAIEWARPAPAACRGPVLTGVEYDDAVGALVVSFHRRDGDEDDCDAPAVGRTLRLRHGGDAGPERYVLEFEDGRSVRLPAPATNWATTSSASGRFPVRVRDCSGR